MKWALPIVAMATVALAMTLAFGCAGRVGVNAVRWRPGGVSPQLRWESAVADGGVVVFDDMTADTLPGDMVGKLSAGLHVWPEAGRSYYHPRPNGRQFYTEAVAVADIRYGEVAVPIWCAEVPCLIAPLLWVWRRRQRTAGRGFAVMTPAEQTG